MNNRLVRQIWDSDVYNRILTYNLRTLLYPLYSIRASVKTTYARFLASLRLVIDIRSIVYE